MAEKFERPLDMVLLVDELPHVEVVFALLQSIPGLGVVYDGVVVGWDIMLFMPIAGLFCCCGKVGLPMPGFVGFMAGKEELREEKVLSGVMALPLPCGADRLFDGGGETGGVDQEKVAGAGEALFARFAGREGKMVEDDAEAFAEPLDHGSPPSISDPPVVP